jgi:hypothetical protein
MEMLEREREALATQAAANIEIVRQQKEARGEDDDVDGGGVPVTLRAMEEKVERLEKQLAARSSGGAVREEQLRRALQETRALMAAERSAAALRMRRREDEHHESARAAEARIAEYQNQVHEPRL